MPTYNTFNEIICDFECGKCGNIENCADKVISDNNNACENELNSVKNENKNK